MNIGADQVHLHKPQIVEELRRRENGYVVKFLFPNGLDDNERWLHAVICMELRRMDKIY
jgi:hypothetical protein